MTTVVLTLDDADFGPAMQALSPKQRAWVIAMVEVGGNYTQAALAAGYGSESDTAEKRTAAARQRGYQLAHDPKVLAATREEAQRRLNGALLIATSQLVTIATDIKHKGQLKAIEMILDRGGMIAKQESTVNINVSHRQEDQIQRIRELGEKLGIDPRKLLGNAGVTVDADFVVIKEARPVVGSLEGLEDLCG